MNIKLERKYQTVNDEVVKKEKEVLGLAVAFIRTRMADSKVNLISETMEEVANHLEVELLDVIVDRSGSRHVDRKEINDLYEWFDVAPVSLLLLESLSAISSDEEDVDRFLKDMNDREIITLCLKDLEVYYPECMEELMRQDKE